MAEREQLELTSRGLWRAGLAIEHAKAGVEPDDLAAALDADPDARRS